MTLQASVRYRRSSSREDEIEDWDVDSYTDDGEEEPAEDQPVDVTWQRIDPWQYYQDKERQNKEGNHKNPVLEARTLRRMGYDKPHYDDFEQYYGKDWTDERSRQWHGL